MGYYNDHHFHFGYFVYAASVIAKTDSNWVNTYGDAVLSLIRDYSNPAYGNGDPNFTFMRNKGFQLEFANISWVINHMTCHKFKCFHWLKLQHSD